ncbi:Uncharacterised protein [Chlamydia trachomatis]|nr:Uncharacterised protein [Chlamydia trachomatis]
MSENLWYSSTSKPIELIASTTSSIVTVFKFANLQSVLYENNIFSPYLNCFKNLLSFV